MGQLKPREVRLLVAFVGVIVILATMFLHGIYVEKRAKLAEEIAVLEAKKKENHGYRDVQGEFVQKIDWLNRNQPVVEDELRANTYLDELVSIGAIEAEGLTYLNTTEKPSKMEPYYWAFERTLTVEGTIDQIVSFLSKLQSETSFRAVTHLHVWPVKKKEPENLRCEVTVQQRYATPEIVAMTAPGGPSVNIVTPESPSGTPPETEPKSDGDAAPDAESPAPDDPATASKASVTRDGLDANADASATLVSPPGTASETSEETTSATSGGNAPPNAPARSGTGERAVRLPPPADNPSSSTVVLPPATIPEDEEN